MKRTYAFILAIVLTLLSLSGCSCKHAWVEASCSTPQTCSNCGATVGAPSAHLWEAATCYAPKTCKLCGHTVGDKLEHQWQSATCDSPETCALCNLTQGKNLEHTWQDATCETQKQCTLCGKTDGSALGHTIENWKEDHASTCTQTGTEIGVCIVCGNEITRELPLKDHEQGDWETTVEPTAKAKGERVIRCKTCSTVLQKEDYTLSESELKALYQKICKSISYKDLERTPGDYTGQYVKFSGYVVQVCSEADSPLYYSTYRVATYGKYKNVVYIYVNNYGSGTRILEDDYITFYGVYDGLYTYTTVRGDKLSIPSIKVEYVD